MLNLTIELFNNTNGEYSYYFELDEIVKVTDMIEKSQDEIFVNELSINDVEIPATEENLEFLSNHDEFEIEAVVTFMEYETSNMTDLYDVKDYMENRVGVSFHEGYNELDAFENYMEELGGVEFVENKEWYFDYEKFKRDCDLSGDEYTQNMDIDEFIEFCEEVGVLDDKEKLDYYFDYEKFMRDCRYNGMGVYELSNCVFMFCN